jgi:hypothetical protein
MPAAPTLPTPAVLPRGYLQIGGFEFGPGAQGPTARCVVKLKPKSSGKVDKKPAQGSDDAKTTWQGRLPADLEYEFSWNAQDADADAAIEEALYQIGPRGPNKGQTQTISGGRLRVHATDQVIVDELEGPDDVPGTSLVTAKLKLSSISKQAQTKQTGTGDATTPTDPKKWTGGGQPTTTVQGFGGDPNNKVTFPGIVPTVTP